MASGRANFCEVAIVGAGPYGLSVAAHLRRAGASLRVFGETMSFWRDHMPDGMLLRSPWQASHLSDPDGALSLDVYARQRGLDLKDLLPRDDLVGYGEWFQAEAVPDLDRRAVQLVERAGDRFRLTLVDGEPVFANRVVIATGLRNQEYRPPAFAALPPTAVSHSCEHTDFAPFRGKHVAVIGRGQSACESAALLAEAGADVEIVSRAPIRWLGGRSRGRLAKWLRAATEAPSAVGPFPLSWLAECPTVVRLLPQSLRDEFAARCLKPAASGWLKPRFGNIACTATDAIGNPRPAAGGIGIDIDGARKSFDHIILGTGYRIELPRLGIFSAKVLEHVDTANGAPLLRRGFESTVPRLHFVGSYAVKSYGPLLRFIAGAPAAARGLVQALRASRSSGIVARSSDAAGVTDSVPSILSPPRR